MDPSFLVKQLPLPTGSIDQNAALARLAAMSKNANARSFALELSAATSGKTAGSDSLSPQIVTANYGPKISAFSPAGAAMPSTTQAGSSGKSPKSGKSNKAPKAPARKR